MKPYEPMNKTKGQKMKSNKAVNSHTTHTKKCRKCSITAIFVVKTVIAIIVASKRPTESLLEAFVRYAEGRRIIQRVAAS